ncbi:hypothetical protein KFU94_00905 [Chloroflexi bacterium TSY]|nr:hypothetical protein [Chloroflexi bacterium TSY]
MLEWTFEDLRAEFFDRTQTALHGGVVAKQVGVAQRTLYEVSHNQRTTVNREIVNKLIHYYSWRLQRAVLPNEMLRFTWDADWQPEEMPDLGAPPIPTVEDWERWVREVEASKNE